ncbi:50S ribosomal protein L23 [bacterium]|nr:50S ribosomal protein L23 [bacterium]
MKSIYEIIKGPLITEKSTDIGEKQNKYVFKVGCNANKIEIRNAIEKIFNVKIEKVNTIKLQGKKKRVRKVEGKTPDWKKAVITLKEGNKIEFI